nr:hypothetical protein GCM10020093_111230 [Planobispora longispora]
MPEPLRIVMADDNYLVREGARRLLEDSGEVVVQAAVGSAPELLDAVRRMRPEAVLTDIRMPPERSRRACPPMTLRRARSTEPPRPTGPAGRWRASTPPTPSRRATRRSAWSSCPSTSTSPTPSNCSATAPPAWPTCSRTASAT